MGISVAFNKNCRLLAVGSSMIDSGSVTVDNNGKPDQYKGQVDAYKFTISTDGKIL